MERAKRRIAATELRVHLGEALKSLEHEDLVIEKGGVPVAIMRRYNPIEAMTSDERELAYERAASKRAEPGGREKMVEAMQEGWDDPYFAALAGNIRKWREEGARSTYYTFDGEEDSGRVSRRQRRGDRSVARPKRVADRSARKYRT